MARIRPAIEFAKRMLTEAVVGGKDVLEVGSWAGQGTARSTVEGHKPKTFIGIDVKPGPGVDEVCRVERLVQRFGPESFDVVFATEVVEHIRDWRTAFRSMMKVLRPEGLLLITTRSPGYPYHGSPHDYWRYEPTTLRQIFAGWHIDALETDPDRPGVFIAARKGMVDPDLTEIALYAVALGRHTNEVSSAQILLHRIRSPRRMAAWLAPNWAKRFIRPVARQLGYADEYQGPSKLTGRDY